MDACYLHDGALGAVQRGQHGLLKDRGANAVRLVRCMGLPLLTWPCSSSQRPRGGEAAAGWAALWHLGQPASAPPALGMWDQQLVPTQALQRLCSSERGSDRKAPDVPA